MQTPPEDDDRAKLEKMVSEVAPSFERTSQLLADDASVFPDPSRLPKFAQATSGSPAGWLKARYDPGRRLEILPWFPGASREWFKRYEAMWDKVASCDNDFDAVIRAAQTLPANLEVRGLDARPMLHLVRAWAPKSAAEAVLLVDHLKVKLMAEASLPADPQTPSSEEAASWLTIQQAADLVGVKDRYRLAAQFKKWGVPHVGDGRDRRYKADRVLLYRNERSAAVHQRRHATHFSPGNLPGAAKPSYRFICENCGDTTPDEDGICAKCHDNAVEKVLA